MSEEQARAAEAAAEAAEEATEAAEEASEAAEEAAEATEEAAEEAEAATEEGSELGPSTEREVGRMEAQVQHLREEAMPELRGRMETLEANQEATLGELRSLAGSVDSLASLVADRLTEDEDEDEDEDEIEVMPEPEPEPETDEDEEPETPTRARTGLARLILGR